MLEINNLTVEFGTKKVLDEVSMKAEKGKVLGIVGESGSGKTMTALSVMGLLSQDARVAEGSSIRLDGKELTGLSEKELAAIRGNDIAMIFQEPMTSLNPTMKIGKQLEEALRLHGHSGAEDNSGKGRGRRAYRQWLKEQVLEALKEACLPEPEKQYDRYPHELSGGMRQRVMIAMGTICRPDYLLCDEPTTALDVTTEKGILELIDRIRNEHNMGIIFITHDLKLLRGFADNVVVMCRGKVVEQGSVEQIFNAPKEEYTRQLIASIPDRNHRRNVKAADAEK